MTVDDAPLAGKRVVVTRARHQAGRLGDLLEEVGASIVYFPTIEILDPPSWEELDLSLRKLADGLYTWVIFTSANGVDKLFQRLDHADLDARAFGRTRVAAVGATTAEALRAHGIRADFMPEKFTGETLAETMGRGVGRVLIPRAAVAPPEMVEVLDAAGFVTEEVVAYRNVPASADTPEAKDVAAGNFDIVTFTSGSTVHSFVEIIGPPRNLGLGSDDPVERVVACIGPKTAAAARLQGFRLDVVADEHTARGLVDAIVAFFFTLDEDADAPA